MDLNRDTMPLLGHISHLHRHAAHELLERQGVSVGQPPVLRYLSENDGCIQRDIAENCHIRAASVSSVLDNMERLGYIERRSLEGDRRAQRIFLTGEGRVKYDLVSNVFRHMDECCLMGIGEKDLRVFHKTLEAIIKNLGRFGAEKEETGDA